MDEKALLIVLGLVALTAVVSLVMINGGMTGLVLKGDINLYGKEYPGPVYSRGLAEPQETCPGRCYYAERGPSTFCQKQADLSCPTGCACLPEGYDVRKVY